MSWAPRTTVFDVSEGGRRARLSSGMHAWVAEVGGDQIETTVRDDRTDARRVPAVDSVSRAAGWMLPWVASVVPSLPGTPKEVVRCYIEDFKNQQRFTVFPRAFAAGFRHHFGYGVGASDWATWVATGRGFLDGFPDVQVEVVDLIAEGPWVVEHNLATGTHQGVFRGVEPTRRVVRWSEVHAYRVEHGRIVENWPCVDFGSILDQLGQAAA